MTEPIFLDGHSTTPVAPRVAEAMWPWLTGKFGNASSHTHHHGRQAAAALETARAQVASLLGVEPREVLFTSGATEANNLALKGVCRRLPEGSSLAVSAIEHRAVLDPARRIQRQRRQLTLLPANPLGQITPDLLEQALPPSARLVSVMWANNEIGTINPVADLAEICHRRGAWLHCDAAQAVGHIPVDLRHTPVDLLSLSAHKFGGPQGVGALVIRRQEPPIPLEPLWEGGGQEHRLRPGTPAVPLAVGLGAACELAQSTLHFEAQRIATLRDRLWARLQSGVEDLVRNGHPRDTLPHNLHVSVPHVAGDRLHAR
ncbi:MAG: cysteine desulfurase family protein, partial [Planctomycetaceae bacterium]